MGVRLYNSATGAFTSRDPIDGGNTTTYAYPQDPINQHDLDGQWLRLRWKKIGRAVLHAGIAIGVGALAVGACVGTAGVGCVIAASIAIGMPAHMIGGLAYDKATRTRVTGRSLQKDMSRPVTKGYSFYNKMKKRKHVGKIAKPRYRKISFRNKGRHAASKYSWR